MGPADAESQRRARGVVAQREYRKRHASKVQALQDENRKLKDAIAEIHRASQGCDAITDQLGAALSKARELAGISDAPAADGDTELDGTWQCARSPPVQSAQLNPPPPVADVPPDFAYRPGDEPRGGKLSPRLDYGLWLETDRLVRIMEPPSDIMPYIGEGRHTMAGFIFWSTVDYTIDLWNARSAAPATRHLDRIFSSSRTLADREYVMSMAQLRLDYKQKGYMFRKLSERADRSAMADLYKLVRHDYEVMGVPPRYWKTPAEVAGNLLGQLTPEETARFEAVLEGRGARADEEMMRAMSAWLVQNFVCFGNGPRWSNIAVSVGLGSWLGELRKGGASAGVREASPPSTETSS
ncbi:hypothetical protein LX32DRAFT_236462 [Colletotrichum zoysiae]|uniref:BZIP domain-containing protein n=1 Tax=Colletotrichum zoysiae TaxID=1216348 RepID=A0AAD9HPB6_9PEZI|nr:hypothetical protein LX32DRAFT_236462 [Colletotrichum zoysiae]